MRKAINLSKGMIESYQKYFIRNANKFISRFKFEQDLLESKIKYQGEEYIFKGQVSERLFIIQRISDNAYFFEEGTLLNDTLIKT